MQVQREFLSVDTERQVQDNMLPRIRLIIVPFENARIGTSIRRG